MLTTLTSLEQEVPREGRSEILANSNIPTRGGLNEDRLALLRGSIASTPLCLKYQHYQERIREAVQVLVPRCTEFNANTGGNGASISTGRGNVIYHTESALHCGRGPPKPLQGIRKGRQQ